MVHLRATLRLIRLSSSGLAFLSIFLPILARTKDLAGSAQKALPLLLGGMCTYILNDLDDLEKDRINHPDRPLPRGDVTTTFVVVLYYVVLALALLSTRFYVPRTETAFLYYAGFAACISYRYIVEYLPSLKSLYVAATTTVPVLILISYYPAAAHPLAQTAIALFLSIVGRELCKDLPDRRGDPASVLHHIAPKRVAGVAFLLQGVAVLILCWQVRNAGAAITVLAMVCALALAYLYWFQHDRHATALGMMKVVVFFGLYFLL